MQNILRFKKRSVFLYLEQIKSINKKITMVRKRYTRDLEQECFEREMVKQGIVDDEREFR
ncbi:MAG: hypothetical protein ACXAEU_00650 [Candidatus Hodarchaeales archaeon]